jgi:flagellar FliL protein
LPGKGCLLGAIRHSRVGIFDRRNTRQFKDLLTRLGLVFPGNSATALAVVRPSGTSDMTDEANTEDIDDQSDDELDEVEGEELLEEGSKKPGRKKLLMIALPILLLVGGGAGVWFSGLADSLLGKDKGADVAEEHADQPEHGTVYYELPQMLVNLSTSGRRTSFLKIVVSLELTSEEDKSTLETALPRIIDNFQVYLRELRIEDLRGSAGLYRLREELLFRVNAAVSPARVTDVLFKEMLVQ